jgi:hypothetical protein
VCGALIAVVLVPLTPAGIPILGAVLGILPATRALQATQPEPA